eukprot:7987044-Alexandrium_andersonii.AAC.1
MTPRSRKHSEGVGGAPHELRAPLRRLSGNARWRGRSPCGFPRLASARGGRPSLQRACAWPLSLIHI